MPPTPPSRGVGPGLGFAVSSYVLWGFLPLLFVALLPSGALEIIAWRIVFSVAFCAFLLTVTRSWPRFIGILRDRTAVITLTIAAVLVFINWYVYIYAATTNHIVEGSLGYFTNPIVTVLLGVFVLRERLRPLQWVAIGVSAVAVLVLSIGYGSFPWIALALAFSFGAYGLVKKRVAGRADAVGGLTMETLVLSPVAIVFLIVVNATTGLTIGTVSPLHTVLMLSVGVATATPLILFAAAARRLPLVLIGLTQYLAPILQFVIGVVLLGEAMPMERWIGFGIVWLALVVLTIDMVVNGTRQRAAAAAATPEGAP